MFYGLWCHILVQASLALTWRNPTYLDPQSRLALTWRKPASFHSIFNKGLNLDFQIPRHCLASMAKLLPILYIHPSLPKMLQVPSSYIGQRFESPSGPLERSAYFSPKPVRLPRSYLAQTSNTSTSTISRFKYSINNSFVELTQ